MLFATFLLFFFFNDTATTEIYTLSLHDALPISDLACLHLARLHRALDGKLLDQRAVRVKRQLQFTLALLLDLVGEHQDRKSTRLNSSYANISYAVFCLKKKKMKKYAFILRFSEA